MKTPEIKMLPSVGRPNAATALHFIARHLADKAEGRVAKPFDLRVTVYGLYSTRDGKIRYVGRTRGAIEKRRAQHLSIPRAPANAKESWIIGERAAGFEVRAFEIESLAEPEAEGRYIVLYRRLGAELFN